MRVVFAGTPDFAARALDAIVAAGHDVPLVLTQPDRPAGRGLRLTASAVSECAGRLGLAVDKPPSLRAPEVRERLRAVDPHVMVVAAYGLLLPADVLAIPGHGCINIHASLLPRWRGAAPVQRALLAGDKVTGISIMRMEPGLDTGPVLLEVPTPIDPRENAGSLLDRLSRIGAGAIVDALARLASLEPRPQDASGATYAAKITRAEARIDWTAPAAHIDRQVRAFNPTPGAEAVLDGERLKIWSANSVIGRGSPGELLEPGRGKMVAACGEGAIELIEVQRPGGRRVSALEFLRGKQLSVGTRLS